MKISLRRTGAVLCLAAAALLQCRYALRDFPPVSRWMWESSDYLHLLCVQLNAAEPALFSRDLLLRRLMGLYPAFWTWATGSLGEHVFANLLWGNWLLSMLCLLTAGSGMFVLTSLLGTGAAAALSVLMLLAGGTDPHGSFFFALGSAAVPHEQALALYPWMLACCLARATGKKTAPWELPLLSAALNIHTPTAFYGLIAVASFWAAAPSARPRWDRKTIAIAGVAALAAAPPLAQFCSNVLASSHAGKEFFVEVYWHYWPVSKRLDPVGRALATAFWISRPIAPLFALWLLAGWKLGGAAAGDARRGLAAAAISLTSLYLLWPVLSLTVFLPALFMASQRAFMPAAIPLLALAIGLRRSEETRPPSFVGKLPTERYREEVHPPSFVGKLPALLVCALLARSLPPLKTSKPESVETEPAFEELALACRERLDRDALVLVPRDFNAFRFLCRRSVFGDWHMLVMVRPWDRALGDAALPLWNELDRAYVGKDWPGVLSVARRLKATCAVIPAGWGERGKLVLHRNDSYLLVDTAGDAAPPRGGGGRQRSIGPLGYSPPRGGGGRQRSIGPLGYSPPRGGGE